MNRLTILLLAILPAFSCVKELDLDSGNCFDVKRFLDSKNATGIRCGTSAVFEGSSICLEGLIETTMNPETGIPMHIALLGGKNYDTSIQVIIEENLLEEIHKELHRNRGRIAHLQGEIRGFDRPQQFKCTRGFEILIKQPNEITFQ